MIDTLKILSSILQRYKNDFVLYLKVQNTSIIKYVVYNDLEKYDFLPKNVISPKLLAITQLLA